MPTKRYKPEQIVTVLRQIEVEIANGKTTSQACKEAQITVQTYYRWRKEFGGLGLVGAVGIESSSLTSKPFKRNGVATPP
jgi:putative transposase